LNDSALDLRFNIELLNPSPNPVQVQIIDAMLEPEIAGSIVGHYAALHYANRESLDAGFVVTVPAASTLVITSALWPTHTVISGMARLRVLTGDEIIVRTQVLPKANIPVLTPLPAFTPSALMGDHEFSCTALDFSGEYTVGADQLFLSLGDLPIPGENPGQYLDGAYGIWHQYTITLANPKKHNVVILVTAYAAGGPARLVYTFGQQWRETKMLLPTGEQILTSFTLPPNARRVLKLTAMPEAGSNYPIRFCVRTK
jgi:hypothetical protein